jgi:hypothetical protein
MTASARTEEDMAIQHSTTLRTLSAPMRWLFRIVSGLALVTGFSLYVLSERTDHFFSWTIASPVTAAFFGACFWTASVLTFLAARQAVWTSARIAAPVTFSFTVLTLIATLLHLDKFHFQSPDAVARGAAWVWMTLYVTVPPITLALFAWQLRAPGKEPERSRPLPRWLRSALGFNAVVMVICGLALFFVPQAAVIWPWKLTPLTAQVTGGWLLAIGGAAAQTWWENDWSRAAIALISYGALGVLQVLALARYAAQVNWGSPGAWLYTIFVLSVAVIGVMCWPMAWRTASEGTAPS